MRTTRLIGCLLAVSALALIGGAPASAFLDGTVVLPVSKGQETSEPHIAINPKDPNNVLVVSHVSTTKVNTQPAWTKLGYWSSTDGGTTWGSGLVLNGSFEGQTAAGSDPVAAFGPDGAAYYAGLVVPIKRRSWQSLVVLGRSSDAGHTFSDYFVIARTQNKGSLADSILAGGDSPYGVLNDKEWVAVDQTAGPHSGTVYAAWDKVSLRTDAKEELLFSRLLPGSSSFTGTQLIAKSDGSARTVAKNGYFPQVSVRPDGTVDLVWVQGVANSIGKDKLLHAFSTDGGASFSSPQTIASTNKYAAVHVPSLATSASGKLFACWTQIYFKAESAVVLCSHSDDGLLWSAPTPLEPNEPSSVVQALPAVAAQGERFWATAYLAGRYKSRVALYRSDDSGASFSRFQTLATLKKPSDDDNFVGDYTGLATTPDHVVAAYVLPESAKRSAHNKLYVSSVLAP